MTLRPPSILAPKPAPALDPLQHEILAEKASALGRATRRFEAALAKLEASASPEMREALVEQAGEALWHLVIQRELCGFRNDDALMRDYRVPHAVRLRMGVRPRSSRGRREDRL